MNPRLARLQKDYEKLQELSRRSPFINIEKTEGHPPDVYFLRLTCKGIEKLNRMGQPIYSESHLVCVGLHSDYPRKGPSFKVLTPIYHPNIQQGWICIGDWAPSMGLDDIIIRVVQMIRYEHFNIHDISQAWAALWIECNRHLFPLDTRQIDGPESIEIKLVDDIQIIYRDTGSSELLDDIVIL